jgi:hypothetical protein
LLRSQGQLRNASRTRRNERANECHRSNRFDRSDRDLGTCEWQNGSNFPLSASSSGLWQASLNRIGFELTGILCRFCRSKKNQVMHALTRSERNTYKKTLGDHFGSLSTSSTSLFVCCFEVCLYTRRTLVRLATNFQNGIDSSLFCLFRHDCRMHRHVRRLGNGRGRPGSDSTTGQAVPSCGSCAHHCCSYSVSRSASSSLLARRDSDVRPSRQHSRHRSNRKNAAPHLPRQGEQAVHDDHAGCRQDGVERSLAGRQYSR